MTSFYDISYMSIVNIFRMLTMKEAARLLSTCRYLRSIAMLNSNCINGFDATGMCKAYISRYVSGKSSRTGRLCGALLYCIHNGYDKCSIVLISRLEQLSLLGPMEYKMNYKREIVMSCIGNDKIIILNRLSNLFDTNIISNADRLRCIVEIGKTSPIECAGELLSMCKNKKCNGYILGLIEISTILGNNWMLEELIIIYEHVFVNCQDIRFQRKTYKMNFARDPEVVTKNLFISFLRSLYVKLCFHLDGITPITISKNTTIVGEDLCLIRNEYPKCKDTIAQWIKLLRF